MVDEEPIEVGFHVSKLRHGSSDWWQQATPRNNPLAFGWPRQSKSPYAFDFAT